MKLSEINIEPLKKDEKNQLHGGFDFVSLASLDADVTNINCAKAKVAVKKGKGYKNVNCGKCSCNEHRLDSTFRKDTLSNKWRDTRSFNGSCRLGNW